MQSLVKGESIEYSIKFIEIWELKGGYRIYLHIYLLWMDLFELYYCYLYIYIYKLGHLVDPQFFFILTHLQSQGRMQIFSFLQ